MSANAEKKKRFDNQQPSHVTSQGRFRDYNGELHYDFVWGAWYSPFLLEISGVKEPPDPGSIPGPATR